MKQHTESISEMPVQENETVTENLLRQKNIPRTTLIVHNT